MGRHWVRGVVAAAILSVVLIGCALTGSTKRETLQLRPASAQQLSVPIVVDVVAAAPDSAGLIATGSMPVGAFSLEDLANIRGSLVDTVRAASAGAPSGVDDRLRLSVVIRRYLVAHSNNAGGVLAVVDWCGAHDDGAAIYREIFYATGEGAWITSLGEIKNRANRGIVQRVAESALRLAAVSGSPPVLPAMVEGTYDDVEAAAATLPAVLKSYAVTGFELPFVALDAAQNLLTPPARIPWGAARTEGSISCQQLQDSGSVPPASRQLIAAPADRASGTATPEAPAPHPLLAEPKTGAPSSDRSDARAGSSDLYCRPAFAHAGVCGQSDPNAR